MNVSFLNITGAEIPVKKVYSLDGVNYLFDFKLNEYTGIITAEIYDQAGRTLVISNKLVYGQNLIDCVCPITKKVIPLSVNLIRGDAGTQNITIDTLGDEIKLFTGISN